MSRLNEFVLGTVVSVDTLFQVRTGTTPQGMPIYTPTDPDTVKFITEDPAGTLHEYAYLADPEITHGDDGAYQANVVPDAEGVWNYRWEGTGAAEGADEGQFRIVTEMTDQYDFLVLPDDASAIRAVLGVAEADLETWKIELATFAGQAEQRVKNRVSNWADQMLDPDRAYSLRLATAYATAALIAETYAKGGTINNVWPTVRDQADWDSLSTLLWGRHEEWIVMAEAWDDVPEVDYDLPMVKASGPSKAGFEDVPLTIPPWTHGKPAWWRGWTKN